MQSTALAGVVASVAAALLLPSAATARSRSTPISRVRAAAVVHGKRAHRTKPKRRRHATGAPVTSSPAMAPISSAPPLPASIGPAPSPTTPVPAPVAAVPTQAPSVPAITGVTYYVSPVGSDSNSGTSPAQAWQTVGRVNAAHLNPGDGVLFQGRQTFSDQVLMPSVSGTAGKPVVFGSYGQGSATITQGAWFVQDDLAFEDLSFNGTFYGGSAVHGASDDITLDGDSISLPEGNQSLGLYANGDHWVIENSTIENTGLSGMLLNGDDYLITANTIDDVALDTTNGYNNHGIYLDASDATITGNTITNFGESAVSARYRNSTITGNTFSGGQIGIDFYQTDTAPGTSSWTGNTISDTTDASVFICGTAEGCQEPIESFTISGNQLSRVSGIYMNLQPISGSYTLSGNGLD